MKYELDFTDEEAAMFEGMLSYCAESDDAAWNAFREKMYAALEKAGWKIDPESL